LLSVDKMSLRPTCHRVYYLTFTVLDDCTNEETTFQAEIIEITFKQYMLGLLRDASHDRVVAVMQIEGGNQMKYKSEIGNIYLLSPSLDAANHMTIISMKHFYLLLRILSLL